MSFSIRLALVSPFLASAILKILDWPAALAEFAALNVPFPRIGAAVVIATQLAGSALLISKRHAWLGAAMLAVFTIAATLVAHPFWTFEPGERPRQLVTFLEHLALVGGLTGALLLGRFSADESARSIGLAALPGGPNSGAGVA